MRSSPCREAGSEEGGGCQASSCLSRGLVLGSVERDWCALVISVSVLKPVPVSDNILSTTRAVSIGESTLTSGRAIKGRRLVNYGIVTEDIIHMDEEVILHGVVHV